MSPCTPRWRRLAAFALLAVALALPLAACGKKGDPEPPPGQPLTYPRAYPQ